MMDDFELLSDKVQATLMFFGIFIKLMF